MTTEPAPVSIDRLVRIMARLRDPATGQVRVAKAGDGVTLTGEPVELALWISGRRDAAHVAVTGSPEAVGAFQAWAKA